jgi:hypothetical protein
MLKEQARFLQGDNPNLMGTVLGFTKARAAYVTDKDSSDKMIYDSFFIYFDHLTGTVTRHLLNKERVNEAFYRLSKLPQLPILKDKFTAPNIVTSKVANYTLDLVDKGRYLHYSEINKLIADLTYFVKALDFYLFFI